MMIEGSSTDDDELPDTFDNAESMKSCGKVRVPLNTKIVHELAGRSEG